MASAIPVEDSQITSFKIKTRLVDDWIRYQELLQIWINMHTNIQIVKTAVVAVEQNLQTYR